MGAGGPGGGPGGGGPGAGGFPPIRQLLQSMELPETWPAVSTMYADRQNRLWVSTFTENSGERRWFLFDEPGNLIGTFIWPANRTVVHADHDRVHVLVRKDDEPAEVIRFRFDTRG